MKKKLFLILLACGLAMTTFMACSKSDNDEPAGNGVDDLAFLQKRLASNRSLVYGVQLGTDPKDIVSRPVPTTDEALAEYYKLLSDGSAHKGLNTANDGAITCTLTDAKGQLQGTVTYRPSQSETTYYCAEVAFSTEVKAATGITRLRYILYDRWPEEGNGFLKDILENIKK